MAVHGQPLDVTPPVPAALSQVRAVGAMEHGVRELRRAQDQHRHARGLRVQAERSPDVPGAHGAEVVVAGLAAGGQRVQLAHDLLDQLLGSHGWPMLS